MLKPVLRIVGRAILLAALAAGLGLVVNQARSDGLPVVAKRPYEIYVPCPMMPAEAAPREVAELPADMGAVVIVDARPAADYARSHIPGSRSLPYHPLNSPPAARLAELKGLGPNRILVVGDTEIDSGRLLAAELAEAGCLGVHYLKGGFEAWQRAGRPVESGGPRP